MLFLFESSPPAPPLDQPFLSYDEIRYALKRLVKGRVLTKGRFNESRFDRTNWYAFTEFGQFLMTESEGRTQ